ncbi:S-methyl-5'-thioadenosine phosphorylase [Enterovibrio baiacu]|uniref:S-methyl-5'-thioadenosine phosphorylase n=1 Tax=Enterovibrio baiacu TaxID=2491023 RepID=UPI001012A844|nr:S-methyl-5'-thioadenosine phosphorylase [Enterovibrio baiacu]MBE1276626.1 S-methyl-5'-thioadenosine phosphorylase [Enterovibrio baiacu]
MLAIIGGTGIYQFEGLDVVTTHTIETPYGQPSGEIIEGKFDGLKVFFLPRHGSAHQFLPHEVNYRANIWALKSLGVTQVIGLSATGSLQQEIAPGDLSLPSQYFDFIKGNREKTFFGEGIAAHVSTAEPTCPQLAMHLGNAAKELDIVLHRDKTYACVDGPRLGTRAESLFLKNAVNADLVGMTNVPEVFLAREAQICYCTVAIATDYDCWQEDPAHHVTVEQVISRYGESLEKAKSLIKMYLKNHHQPADESSPQRQSLSSAILTPSQFIPEAKKALLDVLKR